MRGFAWPTMVGVFAESEWSVTDYIQVGSLAFALSLFALLLIAMARGYAARGKLLLDCGPFQPRWAYFVLFIFYLTIGLVGSKPLETRLLFVVAALAFLASGLTQRIQVRENGLWVACWLLWWDQIDSYTWSDEATLRFTTRNRQMPIPRKVKFPPAKRAEVERLLAERCPRHETARG